MLCLFLWEKWSNRIQNVEAKCVHWEKTFIELSKASVTWFFLVLYFSVTLKLSVLMSVFWTNSSTRHIFKQCSLSTFLFVEICCSLEMTFLRKQQWCSALSWVQPFINIFITVSHPHLLNKTSLACFHKIQLLFVSMPSQVLFSFRIRLLTGGALCTFTMLSNLNSLEIFILNKQKVIHRAGQIDVVISMYPLELLVVLLLP